MNAESQTGLGELASPKLLVHCAVLINIIFDESDSGRNQTSEENDGK